MTSEAAALRKKIKKLSKKLKSKGGNATEPSATVAAVGSQSQGSRQAQSPAGGERFCYRCGEDGHIATKCSSAENEKKVINRLIASLNKAKGKQSNDGNANSETTNCFSKKQESEALARALKVSNTSQKRELVQPNASDTNTDDSLGLVKFIGPDELILSPQESRRVPCQLDLSQPAPKGIIVVETSDSVPLPHGVMFQPVVAPASAIDPNCFSLLIQNETKKEITIPRGTPLDIVQSADLASPIVKSKNTAELDPNLIDFGDSPIPNEWKERLSRKLCRRRNVFSLHEWEVGLAKGVEHNIRLTDPCPFRERSRRLAPADIEDVCKHLQELLDTGVIKESRSPYSSPIMVARKKNGNMRMCIDYRTLNSKTIPDQYTTPCIDDSLDWI
ncbi:hypothetical protein SRHO_G00260850 [Serrasalmus rhombeus]